MGQAVLAVLRVEGPLRTVWGAAETDGPERFLMKQWSEGHLKDTALCGTNVLVSVKKKKNLGLCIVVDSI